MPYLPTAWNAPRLTVHRAGRWGLTIAAVGFVLLIFSLLGRGPPAAHTFTPAGLTDKDSSPSLSSLPANFPVPTPTAACPRIRIRRSITRMNSTERRRFLAAHRRLNDPRSSRPNRFDHLVAHHGQHHDFIHEGAPIFPWHRVFISDYEAALQVIDPAVTLPYWDWSEHGLYPETSPVFQGGSDWFGGNGAGPHHCVPDGALADLPVFYTEEKTFPAGQAPCLRRRFDKANGTMSTWFEDVAIRRWLRAADNYTEFREAIEPPHWLVHTSLAGDMNTRYAPNDVLFFLHHAYIDKLWNDWMAMDLSGKRYSEYNGQFKDGSPAAPTDIIRGYDQIRVVDVIDSTANPRLCYVYA